MRLFVEMLARTMAVLGGIVLCMLVFLTCISVIGRGLNTLFHGFIGTLFPGFSDWALAMGVGPINGDFELVESGVAFAIFAFLPICQYKSSHAVVDILTNFFNESTNRILQLVTDIIFACVLVLITIQLFNGMLAKRQFGETTFLLQFPIWWSYAISLIASSVASLVSIYMAFVRIKEFTLGKSLIVQEPEVDH